MKNKTVRTWHFTDGMKYRDGSVLVVGQPCDYCLGDGPDTDAPVVEFDEWDNADD